MITYERGFALARVAESVALLLALLRFSSLRLEWLEVRIVEQVLLDEGRIGHIAVDVCGAACCVWKWGDDGAIGKNRLDCWSVGSFDEW